jgi:hypothetical protein
MIDRRSGMSTTIMADGMTNAAGQSLGAKHEMPATIGDGKTARANSKGEGSTTAKTEALG